MIGVIVLHALVAPIAAQAVWSKSPDLSSRGLSAVAFDAARGVTVLFGGDDGTLRDDTWTWDGVHWTELSPATRPPARTGHTMTWDSLRQRVLLFGGNVATGAGADTWSFDGTTWTRIVTAHAPTLEVLGQPMVYDAGRDRVVMITGTGASGFAKVWEFDGTDWTQVPTVGPNWPLATDIPFLAYDGSTATTAYYVDGGTPRMWRWNGAQWSSQVGASAPTHTGARMTYDAIRQRLLLVCGDTSGDVTGANLWRWDTATGAWIAIGFGEPATSHHAVCHDTARDRLVVFGGFLAGGSVNSSLWEFDWSAWAKRVGSAAPRRAGHGIASDLASDRLVLYGGRDGGQLGDTWVRDGAGWRLAVPTSSGGPNHPGVLTGFRMLFDEARAVPLLMGGTGSGAAPFPFWKFENGLWSPIQGPSPSYREDCAVAFDSKRQRVVLFGGRGPSLVALNDTWVWNGNAWSQVVTPLSPPPRHAAGMAYDPLRDRVVLVGGTLTSGVYSDTWEFDGQAWHVNATAWFPFNIAPPIAWDAARQVIVARVSSLTGAAQTWQYDGTSWTFASGAGATAPVTTGFALVNSPRGLESIGGLAASQPSSAVWRLATPNLATLAPFGDSGTSASGPLQLRSDGALPWIDARFGLRIGPLPPISLPGVVFGASSTSGQGVPLPLDLAAVGFPGSVLYVSLDGFLPVLPNGADATVDVVLADDPSLVGASVFLQGFVFEPLTSSLTMSNAIALSIGAR